ncbi:ABC transporter permease [Natrinema sp. 1APR25-10V2]|uniref:ABC transporter permease n=1 Tax=Natrinema sp. 1APR25-10V2 TaxID=2951081 RepID=UPI0028765422|nr:ABC transporter permease [Natrinema sp. 1APR25-10V2]MDS0476365.1 ABC transporter permease [Natrinema sp. 1APR25-10V2]
MSTETGTAGSAGGSTSSSINLESVRAVAKKDFQDAVRSWLFWGLSIFFFLLLAAISAILVFADFNDFTTLDFIRRFSQVTKLVVPLIALVLGWKSIAGERETGSIKVLLSLPHSRKDVLLGKLFGRSTVLSLSLLIGSLIGIIALAFAVTEFSFPDYIAFLLVTILYGLAYVSIAVSLSSLTRSTTIAGAAMFGVFVLFYIVWNAIRTALSILMAMGHIEGVTYTGTNFAGREQEMIRLPDWALFIDMIDPGTAYQNTITLFSDVSNGAIGTTYPEGAFVDGIPFYLQDWFSLVILLFWIVVPMVVALFLFDRGDI